MPLARLFLDTEFSSLDEDASLISIGLITQDGHKSFYAELELPKHLSNFSTEYVLPHLGGEKITANELSIQLFEWIAHLNESVVIATDSLRYDWMWLQRLLVDKWPTNLAKDPVLLTINYLNNFDLFDSELEEYFKTSIRHHALVDAAANRAAWVNSGGDIFQ